MLQSELNFRANFIDGRQVWGAKVNGSWFGTVNQVLNKVYCIGLCLQPVSLIARQTSHFAICCISRILQREEVADFTEMTHLDQITFVTRSPGLMTEDIILATPLEPTVWILVVLSFVGLSVVLYLISQTALRYYGKQCHSYTLIYLSLFSIYLNKSVHKVWKVRCNAMRIVYTVWMLAALILAIVYCARLYSLLTVTRSRKTIDTVQEMITAAKSGKYHLVCKKYSSLWNIFMTATEKDDIYYVIGQQIKR